MRKSDISLRIGMVMLLLCAALVLTVLPAAADYSADKPLTGYKSGTITGDLNYTIGNSSYSPKLWSNNSDNLYVVSLPQNVPSGASIVEARLYTYWTWSYDYLASSGVDPEMNVNFDGNMFTTPDVSYTDRKESGTYDYPSGTNCYNVTSLINPSNPLDHIVTVHNSHISDDDKWAFNVQAVGLVVVYNMSGSSVTKRYWIDEGNDITYVGKYNCTSGTWSSGFTPDDAISLANFTNVDTTNANSATLITCVPAGGTQYNRLYVNYFFNYPAWQNIQYWDGLWNHNPYSDFSWTTTEVLDNLIDDKTNYVGFQNGLYSMVPAGTAENQMQAANAFLLLNYTTA